MKLLSFLSCLAILLAGFGSASPPAADQPPTQPVDQMLELADKSPQSFMFSEQDVSKLESSADLIVTSALGLHGNPEQVHIRPGTMRVFRADASLDDFTKQGGWYWRCGDTQGKLQFIESGALIMVVRQMDGTVHWYSLALDFRC